MGKQNNAYVPDPAQFAETVGFFPLTSVETEEIPVVFGETIIVDLEGKFYTKTEVDDFLDTKVDKVPGKGLSTEDFTTSEKIKLDNLSDTVNEDIAQLQINLTNESIDRAQDDDYIKSHAGGSLVLSIDQIGILVVKLKDLYGNVINTSTTSINLETGSMLVSGNYKPATRTLELYTKSGQTKSIDLSSLISQSDFTAHTDNNDIHISALEREYWNGKVNAVEGKGLSTNDFTDALQGKLNGIEDNATHVIVDANLDASSDNAIRNSTVKEALDGKYEVPVEGIPSAHLAQPVQAALEYANDYNANKSSFALKTTSGHTISLTIDDDYKITAKLKNATGDTLGEPQVIDLPLETMVVNARYDNQTKRIILTLNNGVEVPFSVADLVEGLVSSSELADALDMKVDVEAGKGLSTNDFTDVLQDKLMGIADRATRVIVEDIFLVGSKNPPTSRRVQAALNTKVDKITGMGLSHNDFTDILSSKLEQAYQQITGLNIRNGAAPTSLEQKKVNDDRVYYENYSGAEGAITLGGGNYNIGFISAVFGFANGNAGTQAFIEGADNINGGFYSQDPSIREFIQDATGSRGQLSHIEGWANENHAFASHIEGCHNILYEDASYAHCEGDNNRLYTYAGHIEGCANILYKSARQSHVEGYQNAVYIFEGHAEGWDNISGYDTGDAYDDNRAYVPGDRVFSFPYTYVCKQACQGEPTHIIRDGEAVFNDTYWEHIRASHAEGIHTRARATASHTQGGYTEADYKYSFASGYHLTTSAEAQTVLGKYNVDDPDALLIVGGGSDDYHQNLFVIGYTNQYNPYLRLGEVSLTSQQLRSIIENANSWVPKTRTIAGIALDSNIVKDQMRDALGFAVGTLNNIQDGTGVSSLIAGPSAQANHDSAYAFGYLTRTGRDNQFVVGRTNAVSSTALFVVGNGGTYDTVTDRSNAFTVESDGITINGELLNKLTLQRLKSLPLEKGTPNNSVVMPNCIATIQNETVLGAYNLGYNNISGANVQPAYKKVRNEDWDYSSNILHIATIEDLLQFVYLCDHDVTFAGKTIYLDCDLDINPGWSAAVSLSGSTGTGLANSTGNITFPSYPFTVWTNIGRAISSATKDGQSLLGFRGTFDGQGHTISGIYALRETAATASSTGHTFIADNQTAYTPSGFGLLFNRVQSGAVVRNLRVTNSICIWNQNYGTSEAGFGGLIGGMSDSGGACTIENLYCEINTILCSNAHPKLAWGGIVAWQGGGMISNCVYKGIIATTNGTSNPSYPAQNTKHHIGGVCGESEGGTMTDCLGIVTFAVQESAVTLQSTNQATEIGGANQAVAGYYQGAGKPASKGTLTRVLEDKQASAPSSGDWTYTSEIESYIPSSVVDLLNIWEYNALFHYGDGANERKHDAICVGIRKQKNSEKIPEYFLKVGDTLITEAQLQKLLALLS